MKWEHVLMGGAIFLLAVFVLVGALKTNYEEALQIRDERISELEEYIEAQKDAYGGGEMATYMFPIHEKDYLFPTSPFGVRVSPFDGEILHEHAGVDLLGVWKARIVAIAPGVVIDHWLVPGSVVNGKVYSGEPILGGCIKIKHDDGSISVYGHLSWTCVYEGMRVEAGQLIGRQGATGKATGEHLHFELILSEIGHVNPLRYLKMPQRTIMEDGK